MASSLNVTLTEGILGIDAIKNENGGRPSIFFTLGSQKSWKDRETGEWKSKMAWVPVVYSRSASDKLVAALTKSTPVRVRGELESYQKEIGGQNLTMVQIRADDIEFMPRFAKKGEGGEQRATAPKQARPQRQQRPSRRRQPEPDYDDEDENLWVEDE